MHVIVAGCGRVGSGLAEALDAVGHDVVVVDADPGAFRRLATGFAGRQLQGIAFDRATLLQAGVDGADAFVAVTSGDNSNVVAARTARQHFGVPRVVARIYDPERAAIYERYGITTIATARWTTDAILAQLDVVGAVGAVDAALGPGEGDVVVIGHDLPQGGSWEVEAFNRQGRWLLAAVTRTGQTAVPVPRQLVQGGERLHLAVQRTALAELRTHLAGLAGDDDAGDAGGSRPADGRAR